MYQIPTLAILARQASSWSSALLLALPNVFGEEPAIQLSRDDRAAMDEAAQQRVSGILEEQKIAPTTSYLEEGPAGPALRATPTAADQGARCHRRSDAGRLRRRADRACRARRSGCARVGLKPMSLGLDLRGGVHFMYEVDVAGRDRSGVAATGADIRTQLRDERIPYGDVVVERTAWCASTLRTGADVQAAMDALKSIRTAAIQASRSGRERRTVAVRRRCA